MPKVLTEWTVYPHDPIEKLGDNLWRVSGRLGDIQRQMVLAKRKDGGVVIYNAVALDEPQMKELEAWGDPAVLVVPNGYHRVDCGIWKARYPKLKVVAPPKGAKRVGKIVAVDHVTEEAPKDDTVKLFSMDGCAFETCLEVRTGDQLTLSFCDTILNVPKRTGMIGFMLAPSGEVSAPRMMRWMAIKDKRAFAAHLEKLASEPGLARVFFGHGAPVTENAPAALRKVAAQLS
jgi:hypothetical protein